MSFKEQLKSEILPKAVEYYNSGLDINSSIVKAAQDFKLNLDQTDRLLETMNTARVIAHYEKNAEDRTANCDIADKDKVHRMLFEDKDAKTEKKASFGDDSFHDYSFYFGKESDYRHRKPIEKAASSEKPEPVKSGYTIEKVAEKVAKHLKDVENERRFAEERRGMAEAHLATQVTKLASYLSKGYEPERRYALFKAAASKLYPATVRNVEAAMPKQIVSDAAQHLKKLARANVIDDTGVVSERMMAAEIESGIGKMAEIDRIVDACRTREDSIKSLLRKYAEVQKVGQVPFGKPPPKRSGGKKGKDDDDDDGGRKGRKDKNENPPANDPWFGEAAKTLVDAGKGVYNNVVPNAPKGVKSIYDYLSGGFASPEAIEKAMAPKQKKDTSLREYIDNMRRSDLISELYSEDPIISEASPEDVIRAYQTLVQAAPESSLNKEVVRAIIRQSVNSVAVSPFDAKQWSDLDNVLLKNMGRVGAKA